MNQLIRIHIRIIDFWSDSFATWIKSSAHTHSNEQSIHSTHTSAHSSTHSTHESSHQCTSLDHHSTHSIYTWTTYMTHSSAITTHRPTNRLIIHMNQLIRVPVWILTELLLFTHRLLTWLIRLQSTHQYTLSDSSDSRLRLLTHRFMNRLIQLLNQLMSVLLASSVDSFYRHMHSLINSFATWINSSVHTFELQSTYSSDTATRASTHQCTRSTPESILREPINSSLHSSSYPFHSAINSSQMNHQLLNRLLKRIHRLNSPTCALEPSSVYQFESSRNSFYLHIDSLLDAFDCTQLISIP